LSWTSNPDKVPLTLVKLEERDAYFDTFSFRPTGQRFKANMAERIKFHYFHGCKPLGSTRSGILLGTFTNNYDTEMEFDNPQERADKVLGHTTPEVVQEEYIPPTHTMQELFDDGKLDDFTEEVDK
jgi:hypothetical protein